MKKFSFRSFGALSALALSLCWVGCSEETPAAPEVVESSDVQGELIAKPAEAEPETAPEAEAIAPMEPSVENVVSVAEATIEAVEKEVTDVLSSAEDSVKTTMAEVSENVPAEPVGIFLEPSPDEKPPFKNEPLEYDDKGFALVTFDRLASFEYEVPDDPVSLTNEVGIAVEPKPEKDQIPDHVKNLNAKRVALEGFMLPLKVEDGLVTELLMMRDQSMCCFGTVPKINEWVSIRMTNQGIKHVNDVAVTLYGKLKVGEIYENGYLVAIYEMEGETMAGPLDF